MDHCRHELSNCAECAPPARPGRSAPSAEWDGWPGSAIIIHASRKAHLPGCPHIVAVDVEPPVYGWVLAPSPGAWRRLSASSPLRATGGNTGRTAVSRCQDCDATQ
ncbi:hypothetical protein SAMN05216371_8070 [Streptomyces sp. TLI_053]|uniref:hypothetical protein n=1 Tax=Streptomyces sp. TLI_053 TaxID=1855352 RepID=UPI00087BEA04|nr:hypothetical protein [Streptomyces sp. TLI_053]SDT83254.1 hypothetical protein SAMN05216371_8070 [Streptomyces sp. TLI_053]